MKIKSNLVRLMYLNLVKFLSHQVNHISKFCFGYSSISTCSGCRDRITEGRIN